MDSYYLPFLHLMQYPTATSQAPQDPQHPPWIAEDFGESAWLSNLRMVSRFLFIYYLMLQRKYFQETVHEMRQECITRLL